MKMCSIKTLMATAVVLSATSAARADVFLEVQAVVGGSTNPTYYDLTAMGAIGLANEKSIATGISGLALTASYGDGSGATYQNLTLNATLNSTTSVTSGIQLSLFSTSYTSTSTTGTTTAPPGAPIPMTPGSPVPGSTGLYSGLPAGATGYLTDELDVYTHPSPSGSFGIQGSSATYQGYGPSQYAATSSTASLTDSGVSKTAYTAIPSLSSNFDLSSITVDVSTTGTQSVSFSDVASVALPEPSGVITAIAGLPCMGMLVGFARRFRSRSAEAVA